MAMQVGSGSEDEVMVDINTTPLIDVMLVLLIMLIITIPIQLHSVNLNMPQGAPPAQQKDPVVVTIDIDFDGTVLWNGEALADRAALEDRLQRVAAEPDQAEVHIRPNKLVEYKSVATVLASAQRLGVTKLGQHIGHGVLRNFFTGRYHKPREEDRIFMFLDMKSSTTIAEQMGHIAYFELLKRYYADMTEAIQESSGEIYQYVGDEVVITWTMEDGIRNNDCLACFFRIKAKLEREAARYQKDFGTVPGFKAGLHCGHVTTGEIGSMRKDIIFTGDVMNTTARIQSLCNENEVDLLVSDVLMKRLPTDDRYLVREIGERQLKGKDERVHLFTVGV